MGEELVEAALDSADPKSALIDLILRFSDDEPLGKEEHDPELRSELEAMRLKALQARAAAEGIGEDAVDDALEEENPKTALVELILGHVDKRLPSSSLLTKYIPLKGDLFKGKDKGKERKNKHRYEKVIEDLQNAISQDIIYKKTSSFSEFIPKFKKDNYIDLILDSLLYEEKVELLKHIIKEYIETKKIKDELHSLVFDHFKELLIYEKNDQYYILEKKSNVVGFFLMNTNHFYEKEKRKI